MNYVTLHTSKFLFNVPKGMINKATFGAFESVRVLFVTFLINQRKEKSNSLLVQENPNIWSYLTF